MNQNSIPREELPSQLSIDAMPQSNSPLGYPCLSAMLSRRTIMKECARLLVYLLLGMFLYRKLLHPYEKVTYIEKWNPHGKGLTILGKHARGVFPPLNLEREELAKKWAVKHVSDLQTHEAQTYRV